MYAWPGGGKRGVVHRSRALLPFHAQVYRAVPGELPNKILGSSILPGPSPVCSCVVSLFHLSSPESPWERAGADDDPDSPAPKVLLLRSSSSVGGRLARETTTTHTCGGRVRRIVLRSIVHSVFFCVVSEMLVNACFVYEHETHTVLLHIINSLLGSKNKPFHIKYRRSC